MHNLAQINNYNKLFLLHIPLLEGEKKNPIFFLIFKNSSLIFFLLQFWVW
jgi:hypothetical protein